MELEGKKVNTEIIHFDFNGIPIQLIRVTNNTELENQFIERSNDEQALKDKLTPYWSRLWRASIAIGEYLAAEPVIQPGMKVIELGCGLGLGGVVASKLGGEVIFTDYDPNALVFAKKNWELNSKNPASFEIMDWNEPNPALQADLVIGADVAYGPDFGKLLLKTFDVVCKPGGTILLSDPMRAFSNDFYKSFETSKFQTTYTELLLRFEGLAQYQRITKLVMPS